MPSSEQVKKVSSERSYYPNGRVFQEIPFAGGKINGVIREWHRNGTLAKEVPMKDGIRHGTCKQWNDKGELLGAFEMNMGTGISKQWFPNGQIEFEASIVRENFMGRLRRWNEEGNLVQENFFQNNKMVSTDDYRRASESDPTLPFYTDESKEQPSTVTGGGRRNGHERIIARLLSTRTAAAVEWLHTTSPAAARTLGKMNNAKSVAFVTALREAGAGDLFAVDIDEDRAGNQHADKLVVILPTDQSKRQAIRKYCRRRKFEISPENESGHSHLVIFL
jgi:hypothetical protein